ncbi:protein bric-a-brac 2 isoform X2 [Orussus abietinus]|nr:protein bric-a-brac 2 isoform X2 [Orussus abietinus]XP_012284031.1 protein bric-a-brac 2 isoform X2 [Orussus abietinus]XP_012284032.1 protein bric-a-brac 2 isoform X2 [Orussus abietinus]XP_012284033.1 protein bric-a-brac 2 isoform X2 [Orussus abietinus]
MEGQQFCLRWHNFQNTLLSSLPKLLDGGYLTDVTLSAGGRHIHAHRIILSACSYYFKELFKDLNSLQHPVIILPGMEYANLCALVTFMYNGEVNIYQEQLPALLAMADTLHVRGLADIAGKNLRHDNGLYLHPSMPQPEPRETVDMSIKKEAKTGTSVTESVDTVSSVQLTDNPEEETSNEPEEEEEDAACRVKTKPYYSINAKLNQRERKPAVGGSGSGSSGGKQPQRYAEKGCHDGGGPDDPGFPVVTEERSSARLESSKPQPLGGDADGASSQLGFLGGTAVARTVPSCNRTSVTCLICGKQLSNQYNLRVHMETHSNSSYSCTACSHVSRSRDALRKHVSYRHPVASPQKRPRYSTKS